jgi:hypothetical protein
MAGDQNLASGNTYWGSNLTAAVLNGTIPQWRLDDMVVRIMSVSIWTRSWEHDICKNFR